jgi:hypothetical protein
VLCLNLQVAWAKASAELAFAPYSYSAMGVLDPPPSLRIAESIPALKRFKVLA